MLDDRGIRLDPFDEQDFLALCGAIGEQAARLQKMGAAGAVCPALPGLAAARAILLGTRTVGLPLTVFLALEENGRSPCGSDPLAALCTLQGLGAAAFGLAGETEAVAGQLARLRPYASIPLAAALPAPQAGQSPKDYAELGRSLLEAGADELAIAGEAGEEYRSALQALPPRPAGQPASAGPESLLIAACESGCFLLDENVEFSEPLVCSEDMADALFEAEHEGCEALLVRIDSSLDARLFIANAHLCGLPVAFQADEEACLELALAYYSGRAILSSMCDLPRETLVRLAEGYGALVL
ncbi:MAG: hypothetical protein HFG26_11730 [Provencibacterium sp.]|nr:hypothetical protein [Provencibacterium sp.]